MHVQHLMQSLAHTMAKISVDDDENDDFPKSISKTRPSNHQMYRHLTHCHSSPDSFFHSFLLFVLWAHGLHSEALVTLLLKGSLGGTQDACNGSYVLHVPLSHMWKLLIALAWNKFAESFLYSTLSIGEKNGQCLWGIINKRQFVSSSW